MLFTIANNKYLSTEHLRASTMLKAYYIIQKYPIGASEQILDTYIQQQYKITLKNLCITLLLNMTFYEDKDHNLVLLFKNPKYDRLARLITYGNGGIPGSRILKMALNN